MNFNLIIPAAADKPEYEHTMPYIFALDQNGYPICIKAIQGLDLTMFTHIYYVILAKHNGAYRIDDMLRIHLERLGVWDKTHIIVLEEPTASQPETVFKAIEKANISGSIMVKDADSFFTCEILSENSVCTYPLDKLSMVNPQDKSYLAIDEGYFITNIIEKRIIGRHFCTGGYIFSKVEDFIAEYNKLKSYRPLYMSHIVFSMLLSGHNFRPNICEEYEDWGTREDWLGRSK